LRRLRRACPTIVRGGDVLQETAFSPAPRAGPARPGHLGRGVADLRSVREREGAKAPSRERVRPRQLGSCGAVRSEFERRAPEGRVREIAAHVGVYELVLGAAARPPVTALRPAGPLSSRCSIRRIAPLGRRAGREHDQHIVRRAMELIEKEFAPSTWPPRRGSVRPCSGSRPLPGRGPERFGRLPGRRSSTHDSLVAAGAGLYTPATPALALNSRLSMNDVTRILSGAGA
jgi:hypothetical protein